MRPIDLNDRSGPQAALTMFSSDVRNQALKDPRVPSHFFCEHLLLPLLPIERCCLLER